MPEGEGPSFLGSVALGEDDLKGRWRSGSIFLEHPCFAFYLELLKTFTTPVLGKFSLKA